MRKWLNLIIIILIIMSLFGCRTMDGHGSAAGAGTYPLKSTPAAEDTVLLTVVDGTKAGGFDIRRTPVANMPVSTPVSTALGLKQDAATAITESDVQDIVDDAVAGIPGSTVVADETDPTKAAAAVVSDSATNATTADSATYATTAGTAGTVAAVSGDAVTSGTVADTRIASTIARDSEVATAVAITATGFDGNLASTDDTIQELAQKVDDLDITAGTITADTTDPTKAAVSVLADAATTAASVNPVKTSGVPGMMAVYEAEGTSTLKTGFIGPANSTVNFVYQFPNGIPSPGDTWVMGTALTGQALPDGSTGTIIPLTHAAGVSGVPDGTSTNDILSWDGNSWEPIALTDHPAFASLLTAFNNAGLNSFTFPSSSIFPIYTNDATYTLSVDITDTSTTYAVDEVNYKLDSGEYAAMTNTTGDTWSVTLPTQTDGTYDLRFNAADDKSTPNTGESAVYTGALVVDLTNPSIGTVTPSALTHDGTGVTLTATIASVAEPNEEDREWSLYDVTDAAIEVVWTTFTGLSISGISIPADQHTYRVDVRVTDLAGNTGTASSANIVYSAPVSGLEDTFTDTNSTLLSAHTADTSHTWAQVGTSTVNITSNAAHSVASAGFGMYRSSYTPADADYTVSATVTATSGATSLILMARCSTSATTGYGLRFGNGKWIVSKTIAGTTTQIAEYTGAVPTAAVAELVVSGTSLVAKINGVAIITTTDADITSAGVPGIGAYYASVPSYIDNYEVTE